MKSRFPEGYIQYGGMGKIPDVNCEWCKKSKATIDAQFYWLCKKCDDDHTNKIEKIRISGRGCGLPDLNKRPKPTLWKKFLKWIGVK